MATVYPTASGNWSTRTWNNDADGSAYGMAPQSGDIVKANNLAITIDQNITVAELQTSAGTTAAAGGSFTTSGARTVNAISRGATTTCLVLANQGVQNGDSYGGSSTVARGTSVGGGAVQNGNSYAGTGNQAAGSFVSQGGVQNGNSFGGGATVNAWGTAVSFGGLQNGNATGGSGSSAVGTAVTLGGFFFGNAVGGSVSGAHGVSVGAGCVAKVGVATGTTSGAFGVSAAAYSVVLISAESGAFPKDLAAGVDTTTANVPFLATGGGGLLTHPGMGGRMNG